MEMAMAMAMTIDLSADLIQAVGSDDDLLNNEPLQGAHLS